MKFDILAHIVADLVEKSDETRTLVVSLWQRRFPTINTSQTAGLN